MPTPARVAVLPQAQGPLRIEELDIPDPEATQVVVRQFASGVCHSQLHQMHRVRQNNVILGHESTGVVLHTGSAVNHVKEGDVVLVTWVPRDASNAKAAPVGAVLQASDGPAIGNVFTWADHTIVDQQFVVKVDPNIERDVTAIIGCAVMTGAGAVMNTAGVQPGQSVAIFGVGGVGLSAVVGAKMCGADPIIAVDLSDEKLEFAKRFGATHGINADEVDPVEAIHELTRQENVFSMGRRPISGADYTFDCIGAKVTMEQIIPACRPGQFGVCQGGTAVLVGIPQTTLELNPIQIVTQEKHFIGSIGGSCSPERDFPTFLKWFEDGELDLKSLVTERYSLDQINEATTALENGQISGRAILEF